MGDGRAATPEDLGRLLVERVNTGDVEGAVALYEPDAALGRPGGGTAVGAAEIREVYALLVEDGTRLSPGRPRPTVRRGNLALTSTARDDGTVTCEVARRQPGGHWLWALDQPDARD
ncbi:YybH family protein [Pseudonocardia abyssalis]|uniref:SnoaL-like domain-containing protein n=1 Tax=Pseudonocardia abyssalis TaxID=2792008 RepID=A0ABS6V2E8_9PSEU|nr:hypothetical protein [Pseudonocardia abyssalis]MBW0114491.1 hypothetical protein [Pseudonocardia abyssalis]MBW0138179.1 hypothetical protein [Pseudonocardia abyssalis]